MSQSSQAKKQIEDMVDAIFRNREASEMASANRDWAAIQADHSARGMSNSGANVMAITRTYSAAVIRAVENTLEELALEFRQAGRRDSVMYWNIIEPKMKELAISFKQSMSQTASQKLRHIQGQAQVNAINEITQQELINLNGIVTTRIREFRMRSQFIVLKTPDDRLANGVPDVAVMMWFPDPKTDQPEDVESAKLRYEAIQKAVYEASSGLATVNKFDDPSVIPRDRISAEIEVWLEKAVLVICDLTGQRHNVYYEFGYTRAVGTDVVLACPTIDVKDIKLHLGQWPRTDYADLEELKTKLVEKMKVILPKYDLSGSL